VLVLQRKGGEADRLVTTGYGREESRLKERSVEGTVTHPET
jgi:hypothetical protein